VEAGRNVLVEFILDRMRGPQYVRHAWIGRRWKVVSRPPRHLEVFDLAADPAEREDLAPSRAALADSLRGALDDAVATLSVWQPESTAAPAVSPEQRAALRALGYTD
jgi:hypothetical protein